MQEDANFQMYILSGEKRQIIILLAIFFFAASVLAYYLHFSEEIISARNAFIISYSILVISLIYIFKFVKFESYKSKLLDIEKKEFRLSIYFLSFAQILVSFCSIFNFKSALKPIFINDYIKFTVFLAITIIASPEIKIILTRNFKAKTPR
tara:strand:- start:244 stop:696 length:453 start_codon:yes stop_codon:yes gene_type:complete